MAEEAQAMINFYFRMRYGHHIQSICSQHLQKRPHDYTLHFWHACGLMLERCYPEAVREFECLEGNRELQIAVVAALIHCEGAVSGKVDDNSNLRERLHEMEKVASERALLHGATLYCLLGGAYELGKAMEWVLRVLKVQPQYSQALCVKGWIELGSYREVARGESTQEIQWMQADSAAEIFDAVIVRGNHLDGFLGRAWYYELKGQYLKGVNEMNKVVVVYPWFWPALAEKGRLALLLQDWDLVGEIAHTLLQKDPSNIAGLRLAAHVMLSTKNSLLAAADLIAQLSHSIEEKEPKNCDLLLEVAGPLARLAGRAGPTVVRKIILMVEKACKVDPRKSSFFQEMAHQQYLLGEYTEALPTYRLASQLDPLNLEASYGAIQCLLILGEVEDAEQQLELMVELSVSVGRCPSLTYLLAQLFWLKGSDMKACEEHLEETVYLHKQGLSKKLDLQYSMELDPDRLLGIAHLYIELSRFDCNGPHTDKNQLLLQAASVLQLILSAIPSSVSCFLMLSCIMSQLGEVDSAIQYLQSALRLDSTCACGHLLLAKVYIVQQNYDMAKQSLDLALSSNFVVRDTVQFHIAQAQILLQAEDYEVAQKTLESTLCLPEMARLPKGPQLTYYKLPGLKYLETTDSERVQVHVLLANLDMRFGHTAEAMNTIQNAKKTFAGTCEEGQVLLASCGLALAMGDFQGGLQILHQVPRESIYFVQAKVEMADIYLKHHRDKELFARCYLDLADMFHNAKTLLMLAEAYIRIDEPERAVGAFQAAMRESPQDASVAIKVGHSLVTTHQYSNAISHYELALQNTLDGFAKYRMQYDLADLHYKLKHYDEVQHILLLMAERIEEEREDMGNLKSVNFLLLFLKASLLLAKVQNILGTHANAAEVILNAKAFQDLLLNRLQGQLNEIPTEQKSISADMYFQFAKECELQKHLDKAMAFLWEALKCNPDHTAASLALAKIHLARCEISECEQRCSALLRADPFNTEAGDILVRLMLYREKYETAIAHFEQILDTEPNHYSALAQLVVLYQRAGQLDKIAAYLQRADNGSPTSHTHAGLWYCKGLYARYSNKASQALQMLNTARADGEWGKPAIYMMIELYLDLDQDFAWEERNMDGSRPTNEEGVKAAWKLLAESKYLDPKAVKHIVLESHAAMAAGVKADVETVLSRLLELAAKEPEEVALLLAMATAFSLLKQCAKAKSQLRSIEKLGYRWEDGDDFERAWLMLASIYLQARKHDSAEELCRKCLKYNKSCARAWECLGLIGERNHAYAEAAAFYENAWKCHRESSPSVGYRLAYSYLKDKQLVRAISICHKVIKAYPNYPRIKKDILDKARSCVRA